MAATFSIEVDPARAIIRITLSGFFELADVAAFAAEQRVAYARLHSRQGNHVTLCDVSGCKIQSQAVFTAFRALIDDPRLASRRIAFVTGMSPARLQIRRIDTRDNARSFGDRFSAECWLFAPMTTVPAPMATVRA